MVCDLAPPVAVQEQALLLGGWETLLVPVPAPLPMLWALAAWGGGWSLAAGVPVPGSAESSVTR